MTSITPFIKPIAHRGLHGAHTGKLENTGGAFEAAIASGYGVECDVQQSRDGVAMVHHDATLDRLFGEQASIRDLESDDLRRKRYPDTNETVMTLADLLSLIAGRQPILIEIKSNWQPPDTAYLGRITDLVSSYEGAAAIMSFDPAVMTTVNVLAPTVPRGIVAQAPANYSNVSTERAYALGELLETGPADPDFIAYDVRALPTAVTRYARDVSGLPLFAWTVRSDDDQDRASMWSDAPIFEERRM